jgi:hypothetical protein
MALCFLGMHSWEGCKCSACGKQRNLEHLWRNCTCTKCGKVQDADHIWDGCKCSNCGKIRDTEHEWDGCKCTKCGRIRELGHIVVNCQCTKCGNIKHEWINCRCVKCGEENMEQYVKELLDYVKESLGKGGHQGLLNDSEVRVAASAFALLNATKLFSQKHPEISSETLKIIAAMASQQLLKK